MSGFAAREGPEDCTFGHSAGGASVSPSAVSRDISWAFLLGELSALLLGLCETEEKSGDGPLRHMEVGPGCLTGCPQLSCLPGLGPPSRLCAEGPAPCIPALRHGHLDL